MLRQCEAGLAPAAGKPGPANLPLSPTLQRPHLGAGLCRWRRRGRARACTCRLCSRASPTSRAGCRTPASCTAKAAGCSSAAGKRQPAPAACAPTVHANECPLGCKQLAQSEPRRPRRLSSVCCPLEVQTDQFHSCFVRTCWISRFSAHTSTDARSQSPSCTPMGLRGCAAEKTGRLSVATAWGCWAGVAGHTVSQAHARLHEKSLHLPAPTAPKSSIYPHQPGCEGVSRQTSNIQKPTSPGAHQAM